MLTFNDLKENDVIFFATYDGFLVSGNIIRINEHPINGKHFFFKINDVVSTLIVPSIHLNDTIYKTFSPNINEITKMRAKHCYIYNRVFLR